ncbi:MAG: L-rhamnose/proton symporter RhaT [Parvibaculales bacterium]
MAEIIFPLSLVVIASIFQGTFGLGMKYTKPLAWEAWWLVHVTIAMVLFPLIWALLVVPDLFSVIANSPSDAVRGGMFYGFLWGIGGIMFGLSVPYIGMALTYGIVMGLAAMMGSLIPLFQLGDVGSNPAAPIIITGIILMLIAVAIVASAGIKRDKVLAQAGKKIAGIQTGKMFRVGLCIAIACGVLSSLLNVGFSNTLAVGEMAEDMGAEVRNGALARWVVVLIGAYIMNAGYALFLLFKNKSWSSFKVPASRNAYKWAVIAGLLWFAALGVYGQGAALMGTMGPIIGWPILLGLALIISTALGIRTGEWKGAPQPFKLMIVGIAILIFAICILGYSNSI